MEREGREGRETQDRGRGEVGGELGVAGERWLVRKSQPKTAPSQHAPLMREKEKAQYRRTSL